MYSSYQGQHPGHPLFGYIHIDNNSNRTPTRVTHSPALQGNKTSGGNS